MDKNTKETLLGIDLYKNLSREELILGLLASTAREDEMKPRKVFVEAAEMEKIDDVLRAFGSYIHGHYYFDILVSPKFGVVRPDIDGNYEYFADADSLFYCLIDEIYHDVRDLKIVEEHMTTAMCPAEEAELCRRVIPLINKLQDREHYNKIFRDFLNENRE